MKKRHTRRSGGDSRIRRAGPSRFQVTIYDGTDTNTEILSLAQVRALDLKNFDCCRAKALGVYGFRNPQNGEWVQFGKGMSRGVIGPTCGLILEALQWNQGLFLNASMLVDLTGKEHLYDGANVAARVHSLRKAFGETKDTEHFILTLDGGVAWPKELTWVSVEVLGPEIASSEASDPVAGQTAGATNTR